MDVFVGRQPILDVNGKLVAYEILFRDGENNFSASINDDVFATSNVIANTLFNLGIGKVLGGKKGFINFNDKMFMNEEIISNLPKDEIVIEILETVELNDTIVKRAKELKERGYTVALDDFTMLKDGCADLFKYIEIIKVDIIDVGNNLENITKDLKDKFPKIKLLAEKVENAKEFEICKNLGYSYFQGYYFSKPVVIKGKKLSQNQYTLLNLISLLNKNADINEIVNEFKNSPKLSYQLLNLLNSSMFSFRVEIQSIRQAIVMLGNDSLKKWVSFLLYLEDGKNICEDNPISQLVLTRARTMELLESYRQGSNKKSCERAFTVGLLSLVDVVLCIPKEEIFDSLILSEEIKVAILHKEGHLGKLLQVIEFTEKEDFKDLNLLLKDLTISLRDLGKSQREVILGC